MKHIPSLSPLRLPSHPRLGAARTNCRVSKTTSAPNCSANPSSGGSSSSNGCCSSPPSESNVMSSTSSPNGSQTGPGLSASPPPSSLNNHTASPGDVEHWIVMQRDAKTRHALMMAALMQGGHLDEAILFCGLVCVGLLPRCLRLPREDTVLDRVLGLELDLAVCSVHWLVSLARSLCCRHRWWLLRD